MIGECTSEDASQLEALQERNEEIQGRIEALHEEREQIQEKNEGGGEYPDEKYEARLDRLVEIEKQIKELEVDHTSNSRQIAALGKRCQRDASDDDPEDDDDQTASGGEGDGGSGEGSEQTTDAGANRPDIRSLVDSIRRQPDDPGVIVSLKRPKTWTEDEMKQAMNTLYDISDADPRRKWLRDGIDDWFKHYYPGNVQWDATGKMVEPKPAFPFPKEPAPITTSDGRPFDDASDRFGRHVAAAAGDTPVPDLVAGLQSGMNLFNDQHPAGRRFTPLAEDGDFGPKTQAALHQTLADIGSGRTTEALALGRFNTFARQAVGRSDAEGLKSTAEAVFGPLFPREQRRDVHPKVAELLQHTINDIGVEQDDRPEPISVDGDIGPQTAGGFGRAVRAAGPEEFTRRFARNLGFF